jgi:hypothetical protein
MLNVISPATGLHQREVFHDFRAISEMSVIKQNVTVRKPEKVGCREKGSKNERE